jgi:hypothetical protein
MIMTEDQKTVLQKIKTDFETLWNLFCQYIPKAKEIVSKKDIAKFGMKYAERYESLCDNHREYVKSPCLFDEFISSFGNDKCKLEFKNEIEMIAKTIMLSLHNAQSLDIESIINGINDIVRQMILTLDLDTLANNPDYRNRLNELLVFNWLIKCENITITDIAYPLGNGKDCDFRCYHKNGQELLIEVMSIQNIDLTKQDNADTFSEFIKEKIKKKYADKTKNLGEVQTLKILTILDYVDGLTKFAPTLDATVSLPPFTVVKNTIDGKNEILLITLDQLISNQQ